MVSRATVHTKAEVIEATVAAGGNLCRAGIRLGLGGPRGIEFRRGIRLRFGLTRRVVRDVLIIEDRSARVEVAHG